MGGKTLTLSSPGISDAHMAPPLGQCCAKNNFNQGQEALSAGTTIKGDLLIGREL